MFEDRIKWIEQFESGQNWMVKLPSERTKEKFASCFTAYCKVVKKNPDELLRLKPTFDELLDLRDAKNRGEKVPDIKSDSADKLLEKFFRETIEIVTGTTKNGKELKIVLTPNVRLMFKNAIFSFYKWNGRELTSTTASNVKNETPESKKRAPTLQDLTELGEATTTDRDDSLVWLISSTSCRIGSIPLLLWKDRKSTEEGLKKLLEEKKINMPLEEIKRISSLVPYYLEIEAKRLKGAGIGKYKGLKQITFIHKFANEKLEAYRKEAELKGYKLTDDSPLFISYRNKGEVVALSSKGINNLFDDFSLNAWKDLEVKKFSAHDIRDFFQSALESANIHVNMIAPLMAHKIGSPQLTNSKNTVDQHYSSHQWVELLEKYITALPFLIPKSVEQVEAELVDSNKTIETQQTQLAEQGKQIAEHKKESEAQNSRISDLEEMVKKMVMLRFPDSAEYKEFYSKHTTDHVDLREKKGKQ